MNSEVITVHELMVPLEEYAMVREDATLFEAVMELEKAQERRSVEKRPYLHRAILVQNKQGKVIGKIGHIDILRGLEPRYKKMGDTRTLSRAGFSPQFLETMMETYSLCDTSLIEICSKGANIRVKDFMYTPEAGEYIEADSSLCEAIHRFILGSHIGLLVVEEGEIVGVLRLSDAFMKIFELMKQCER
jgi:CBS domain-containing protein